MMENQFLTDQADNTSPTQPFNLSNCIPNSQLPVISEILGKGTPPVWGGSDAVRRQSQIIEKTLAALDAPVRVREIHFGPKFIQFCIEPSYYAKPSKRGQGQIRRQKIENAVGDLQLALSAKDLYIQPASSGSDRINIIVRQPHPVDVRLRDVMESEAFVAMPGSLRLGIGVGITGESVVADLRQLSYLLITGIGGSGRSTCIHALLAALLFQNTPNTLRLLLIDTRRIEFMAYYSLPHLLTPSVVAVDQSLATIHWLIRETDSRLQQCADLGVRTIEEFNRRVSQIPETPPLPYVVVVIDELTELMTAYPDDATPLLCRLTQKARYAGIYLILATQAPRMNTLPSILKSQIQAHIALKAASATDSKFVLGETGAETLTIPGDMLFKPQESVPPTRIQGTLVSASEIDQLTSHWRTIYAEKLPQPLLTPTSFVVPESKDLKAARERSSEDVLLPSVIGIFLTENRASASLLQRRLRIGYTRAARLVETLIDMGIVLPETQGQSRVVNREAAQAFLQSLSAEQGAFHE